MVKRKSLLNQDLTTDYDNENIGVDEIIDNAIDGADLRTNRQKKNCPFNDQVKE